MKQVHQLDAIDRRILSLLQDNADLSHAAMAELVGASTASCWRRIKALQASGILLRSVRLVDAEKVGRGVTVLCDVRMRGHEPPIRQAFEDFVQTRGEIMECFSMSGEWDYQLRIVAQDVADYERFLMRQLLGHSSVLTAATHFALSQIKYTTKIPV